MTRVVHADLPTPHSVPSSVSDACQHFSKLVTTPFVFVASPFSITLEMKRASIEKMAAETPKSQKDVKKSEAW